MDELAVTDALAAARDDGIGDGKLGDGNTKLRRGQAQQRLVRVGGNFANVGHAIQKACGSAAVRRPVGVTEDERDGFRAHAQFFGNGLRVVGAHACAGFGSAGVGEDGVVAVDFEPRGEHGGIKRRGAFGGMA